MRLPISMRLALGLAPALIALMVVGGVSLGSLKAVEQDQRWVRHTTEVLQRLGDAGTSLAEAESGARGYRLTGDEDFVEAYRASASRLHESLASLRVLVRDNAAQLGRLIELEPIVARRLKVLEALIARGEWTASRQDDAVRQLREISAQHAERSRVLLGAMREEELALLAQRSEQARRTGLVTGWLIGGVTGLTLLVVLIVLLMTARSILRPLQQIKLGAQRVGSGDYRHRVPVPDDEFGQVAEVFNRMTDQVRDREERLSQEDWIKSSLARFPPIFQAQHRLESFCRAVLAEIAAVMQLPHAVLYRRTRTDGEDVLLRCGSFAADGAPARIALGEGAAGQCAVDGRILELKPLPDGHVRVASALGASSPSEILVLPAVFEGHVKAVLELAFLRTPSSTERDFIERLMGGVAVALNGIEAREQLEAALEQSTQLTGDLQHKQEELSQSYEELEAQAEQLRHSSQLLREQQDELQQANDEYEQVNADLRQAAVQLEERSRQLETASAYKSEFLANMSHELRTPLNSLLILSQLLAENRERTLNDKQVQYARTIHAAGEDLLALISDILDLAKIESGTVELDVEDMPLAELLRSADSSFRALAESKGVQFELRLAPGVPPSVPADPRRLWQIVKNLLSNAFKFTSSGRVALSVEPAAAPQGEAGAWIAVAVTDTGIGIPADQLARIFESFHQGDRGTARKFGGTGLGLAISQRLAAMMGGRIEVRSTPGEGSCFTLVLPLRAEAVPAAATVALPAGPVAPTEAAPASRPPAGKTAAPEPAPVPGAAPAQPVPPQHADAHRCVMVAHRDPDFIHHVTCTARPRGFDVVAVSELGKIVTLCRRTHPTLVVLEASMGDDEGWVALGLLKQNAETRHVPVHLVCDRSQRERALRLGAASALPPASLTREVIEDVLGTHLERLARPYRRLLVVEDDEAQRLAILELIGNGDVKATGVGTAAAALEELRQTTYDCLVVDLGLPDMEGADLLAAMHEKLGVRCPPVVIYTGRDLTRADETRLKPVSEAIIVKGASSPERLLSETALLLSRQHSRLPERKQRMIERGNEEDPVLRGRRVLAVDDDVRNIFAITAALEAYGVEVLHADSGRAALDMVTAGEPLDAVLMDVMMPEMDGFEAMRRIRALAGRASLPMIAITAKAMPGDRQRCLDAGASDYLTKPVDMDRLRAMLRVWLTIAAP